MQYWQSVFSTEVDQLLDVARIAEELGFDGLLISDHLLHFEKITSRYPYSPDGKPPSFSASTEWPEAWSTIAAMCAVTRRLRFVTNVYILPLRHPVEVAKQVSSVASLFEGRVGLGVGAGWMKEEFDAVGVDFDTRGARLNEAIELVRKLWSGDTVEHHGRFFELPPARMCPVPKQPIPILVGGMSRGALRRAARYGDGWIGAGQRLEEALETLAELRRLREREGRADQPFETIVPLVEPLDRQIVARLEEAGVSGVVSYPFVFELGPRSSLADKRAYMERFAERVIRASAA
ncbi:MAG: TIGR03619 family F420-dependent LLM class oxidoreductase [Candidatus Dadabacteria bacterium]|nr:MAG: TIGR03619 family F420-dependent LLM class oxidoreductase [Candidatus Dadabacteria bacterium]